MADDPNDNLAGLKGDERIVRRAQDRFTRCKAWESNAQARWLQDTRFANADPDNGYQWPNSLWSQRRDDPTGYKPRLTINKTRTHNLQIINDAKQNKPGIHIRPVGGDATFKAAQVWEGLVRQIERVSKAQSAYDTASTHQVNAGIGYIRVVTEYVDQDSFEQEIRIRRVKNPLNIYMDPDVNEVDYSDARFGFQFEDLPRDEFLKEHPEMRGKLTASTLNNSGGWVDDTHVRRAEYFERVEVRDRLVLMSDPGTVNEEGQHTPGKGDIIARWSKIPAAIRGFIDPKTIKKEREILDHEVKWYKIVGDIIVDRADWPGRFIPIVPVIGEETIIDGILDRKGHTRNLKDAQRMYNYWTSSSVEHVALQTKTRWFVPLGATENLETYWARMNTSNSSFIPYNAMDTEGNPLPAPTPIEPPVMAEGYIKGMMVAQNELMMASGQYQSQMGQNENAKSGKAIAERQRQGDNATYHYIDGLAIAIRQVGNIILDIAPHVYDTQQVKRILAEDGTESEVTIDPNHPNAYEETKGPGEDEVLAIFNPNVGRYWVESDVGPSYSTKRQEAWDAFVQIVSANKELVGTIGDLMFRNADFPGALEIAERLKRTINPAILGEGPDAVLVAAQQENQRLQQLLGDVMEKLAKQELELRDKQDQKEVNLYDAETRRLKEAGNAMSNLGPDVLRPVVADLLAEMLGPGSYPVIGDDRRMGDGSGEEPSGGTELPGEAETPLAVPPAPQNGISEGEGNGTVQG